jgi:hypothetical protein
MIRWTRSAEIAPGKIIDAIQWGKEIAEFVNKKHGAQSMVYIDIFGEYGKIRWFWDCEDLATLEKVANKINVDPEYLKILNRGTALLVSGSVWDTVMRKMS